MMSKKFWYSSN